MGYSEILKDIIMEQRHLFIYGKKEERTKYLKNLANQYKFNSEKKQPIVIYTDYSGLPDCNNESCNKYEIDSLQKSHYEIVMVSLIFEKLFQVLSNKDQNILEHNLMELFFNEKMKTLENVKKILQESQEIYQEVYEYYIKNAKIKIELFEKLEIDYIIMDMFLPHLKEIIPQIRDFTFFINKTNTFGRTYTQVINAYIASRSQNYLNMKVACDDMRDWDNYWAINGEYIEQTHDYSIIMMDEWSLKRSKEVQ